ncbi:hypothetical protein BpHYR1_038552 [Brachionus plicatilis]|uniref:Uncharacterized protein n=1 Tax=Brachionus plicatilis TaxID=10195 RepID=A0A3M7R2L9_BRAPC|nr:hypothetical protein BpHYR1_038552 [Brachionus plicatilis]
MYGAETLVGGAQVLQSANLSDEKGVVKWRYCVLAFGFTMHLLFHILLFSFSIIYFVSQSNSFTQKNRNKKVLANGAWFNLRKNRHNLLLDIIFEK